MPQGSGPPYPPLALTGSNVIGRFAIGISPVGDIPSFNLWSTIISQYANTSTLARLCTNMGQYFDPTYNMDEFFDTMFDVDTAVGYGLNVWGRIVGVGRIIQIPPGNYLGFAEADSWQPFGQAPFFGGTISQNNLTLDDDSFRTLILAKALSNICDGSIPAINQILINLFPNLGNCYVIDGQDMTMTYRFLFPVTQTQQAIIQAANVLPRTSGVLANVVSGATS